MADFSHDFNLLQDEHMIHARDHKTSYMFDPWGHLGSKRRRLLDESWAGLFRDHVLNELPVEKISSFFHEDFGRPTKELFTALGTIILQQAHDLSDEETIFQLAFNEAWHYALDIPNESDAAKYMSPKTIWNFRKIITDNELDGVIFENITGKLAGVFGVNTGKQRLDSVHIKSNMRRLGRIGIFAKSIKKFLTNLKRHHRELFDELDAELIDKYLSKKELGCFSLVKPSETAKRLVELAEDLFELIKRFSDNSDVTGMSSFELLIRVFEDQCDVSEASDDLPERVSLRPAKEVGSDSLQNPSDPEAAYDGHKGQGYQVQIMETFSEEQEQAEKDKKLNLITHVEVEPANQSDANAVMPAIESVIERDLSPEEVLADSLYGSDENIEAARKKGVAVVAPTMGKPKKKEIELSDFEFSEKGIVTACPAGHAPKWVKKKDQRYSAGFDSSKCRACPMLANCQVKPGKKWHYLYYSAKSLRLSKRRASEQSPEFKDRYRYRSGVEATMSEYDRRTGAKRLRVRGFPAVRMAAKLKALAINIFRATRVRKALSLVGVDQDTVASSNEFIRNQAIFGAKYRAMTFRNSMSGIWRRLEEFFAPARCEGKIFAELVF